MEGWFVKRLDFCRVEGWLVAEGGEGRRGPGGEMQIHGGDGGGFGFSEEAQEHLGIYNCLMSFRF